MTRTWQSIFSRLRNTGFSRTNRTTPHNHRQRLVCEQLEDRTVPSFLLRVSTNGGATFSPAVSDNSSGDLESETGVIRVNAGSLSIRATAAASTSTSTTLLNLDIQGGVTSGTYNIVVQASINDITTAPAPQFLQYQFTGNTAGLTTSARSWIDDSNAIFGTTGGQILADTGSLSQPSSGSKTIDGSVPYSATTEIRFAFSGPRSISLQNLNTINASEVVPAGLGNYVWEDLNGDGKQDDDEPGIEGVTVKLLDSSGNHIAGKTTVTDDTGFYQFTGLAPGQYRVEFVKPGGYEFTFKDEGSDDTIDSDADETTGRSHLITLVSGQYDDTIDAGLYRPANLGSVMWIDENADGEQNSNETFLPSGLKVTLTGTDGRGVNIDPIEGFTFDRIYVYNGQAYYYNGDPSDDDPTVAANGYALGYGDGIFFGGLGNVNNTYADDNFTDVVAGKTPGDPYLFTGLRPGTYQVTFELPNGYVFTIQNASGVDYRLDSDADPATGKTGDYVLRSGDTNLTADAGVYKPAELGDRVWHDLNYNGIQDAGELGIANVEVRLLSPNGDLVDTQYTDADGYYLFTGLKPGAYKVQFVTPTGYILTLQNQGSNDEKDSDADSDGFTGNYGLGSGQSNLTVDAGMYQYASLGDFVWLDTNKNGIQESGELGIAGVTVKLFKDGIDTGVSTTTNSSGYYIFNNLTPGEYSVQFVAPTGYAFTLANQGSNDAIDSDANSTGMTGTYVLTSGQTNLTVDAGLHKLQEEVFYNLEGYKFHDRDASGDWNTGEEGLSGWLIYVDYNNDGKFNSGEAHAYTDSTGYYKITGIIAGTYTIREVMQTGWLQTTVEPIAAFQNGTVTITVDGQQVNKANFGNVQTTYVNSGDTATIGFWQNKNGQAVIRSLNGGENSTALGNWLAATLPNMYGVNAGANNLAGKTNAQIAAYFIELFKVKGMKLEAQVLGVALAVYVTDYDLSQTTFGSKFGFNINSLGVGSHLFNIGKNGAAFGVANYTTLTVMQILLETNDRAVNGVLWNGNSTFRVMGNEVYTGINEQGDI